MRKSNKEKHQYKTIKCEQPWDDKWKKNRYKSKRDRYVLINDIYSSLFSGKSSITREESLKDNSNALHANTDFTSGEYLKNNKKQSSTLKSGEQLSASTPSASES